MTNKYLLKQYKIILGKNKPVIFDIGARNGVKHKLFNYLANNSLIKLILVELDKKESRKLKSKNILVINKALWNTNKSKIFYQTKNKSYVSLLEPNKEVLHGSYYFDRYFYKVLKKDIVKTITLKEIISNKNNKINKIDFIKIDIQGGESKVFDTLTKKNWSQLLACETETYTSKVYKGSKTIDYYIRKFYSKNFELYNSKCISSLIKTSYDDEKIYSANYLTARPNTRYYRGKQLTLDLLFFKNFKSVIKKNDIDAVRRYLFFLIVYEYFDHAIYVLLYLYKKKIIKEIFFSQINSAIKNIFKEQSNYLWRVKEKILLKMYSIST